MSRKEPYRLVGEQTQGRLYIRQENQEKDHLDRRIVPQLSSFNAAYPRGFRAGGGRGSALILEQVNALGLLMQPRPGLPGRAYALTRKWCYVLRATLCLPWNGYVLYLYLFITPKCSGIMLIRPRFCREAPNILT